MLRLILIVILILVIFWVGRSVLEDLRRLSRSRPGSRKTPSSSSMPVSDKLVQDPVCGVYCPKGSAYTAIWKGKVYYFCSEECRQKFLKERSSASSSG